MFIQHAMLYAKKKTKRHCQTIVGESFYIPTHISYFTVCEEEEKAPFADHRRRILLHPHPYFQPIIEVYASVNPYKAQRNCIARFYPQNFICLRPNLIVFWSCPYGTGKLRYILQSSWGQKIKLDLVAYDWRLYLWLEIWVTYYFNVHPGCCSCGQKINGWNGLYLGWFSCVSETKVGRLPRYH